jgi:hypothetical protein
VEHLDQLDQGPTAVSSGGARKARPRKVEERRDFRQAAKEGWGDQIRSPLNRVTDVSGSQALSNCQGGEQAILYNQNLRYKDLVRVMSREFPQKTTLKRTIDVGPYVFLHLFCIRKCFLARVVKHPMSLFLLLWWAPSSPRTCVSGPRKSSPKLQKSS